MWFNNFLPYWILRVYIHIKYKICVYILYINICVYTNGTNESSSIAYRNRFMNCLNIFYQCINLYKKSAFYKTISFEEIIYINTPVYEYKFKTYNNEHIEQQNNLKISTLNKEKWTNANYANMLVLTRKQETKRINKR